jgi:putative NADH-flavin reductase
MASRRLLVLGASGRTGQHVITKALQSGHMVTAFVRDPQRLTITSDRLRILVGNTKTDQTALDEATHDQDVVISTLGAGDSFKPDGVIAQSMTRILHAMQKNGVRRLIFTSAFGVGETFRDTPFVPRVFMRTLLRNIYRDKYAAEVELKRSALDWTLVYPTGLSNAPATGHYRKGERLPLKGFPTIPRADLADFLLTQIDDTSFLRKGVLVSS